jgi:hemerythrin superfamily protein
MLMRRDVALIPLSREHHRILMCALLLKTDAVFFKGLPTDLPGKKKYAKSMFDSMIFSHMEAEEKVIFPLLKQLDEEFRTLVSELESEHREIRRLTTLLDEENHEILKVTMEELGKLMTSHVRKEERILFQRMQAILTEQQMRTVGSDLMTPSRSGD